MYRFFIYVEHGSRIYGELRNVEIEVTSGCQYCEPFYDDDKNLAFKTVITTLWGISFYTILICWDNRPCDITYTLLTTNSEFNRVRNRVGILHVRKPLWLTLPIQQVVPLVEFGKYRKLLIRYREDFKKAKHVILRNYLLSNWKIVKQFNMGKNYVGIVLEKEIPELRVLNFR